jgi:hypothetical protein
MQIAVNKNLNLQLSSLTSGLDLIAISQTSKFIKFNNFLKVIKKCRGFLEKCKSFTEKTRFILSNVTQNSRRQM